MALAQQTARRSLDPGITSASELATEDWRFLAESSLAFGDATDTSSALATMLRLAVPRIADLCIVRLHGERASGALPEELERLTTPTRVSHALPEILPYLQATRPRAPEVLSSDHPAARVVLTGKPELTVVDDRRLTTIARSADHLARLRAISPRSAILVPISGRGRVMGSVMFVSTRHSGRLYRESDLALACHLTKQLALALEHASRHERAQRALLAHQARLATTVHDLKDPLSAVQLAIEFVLEEALATDGDTSREARESLIRAQLGAAAHAAARMRRLVETTLDTLAALHAPWSRASADRTTAVAPAALLESVSEQYRMLARAGGIELVVEAGPSLPRLQVDGDRMLRALANVVGNAIKFTPPGGRVTARVVAEESTVRFTITDSGPGIPRELQARLFTRLWQSGGASHSGSGLGLGIARSIVMSAGGEIGLTSTPGTGTTVWIVMPGAA